MANDLFDTNLGEKSLSELEGLGDMFERNANQARDANRAGKGFGPQGSGTQMDELSKQSRKKQTAVDLEINDRLMDIHESRSKKARIADESKDAERAPSAEAWAADPDQYDWPGIDTKK